MGKCRINQKSLKEIKESISKRKGLSTYREIYESDLNDLIKSCPKAKKRVRVYSQDGFVSNAYKWRCRIQYIEATAKGGEWHIRLGDTSAQRSYGEGAHIVIQ